MNWLINHEPYEVQSRALQLTDHNPEGFAYFMEMGLGKTAVTIAEFMRLRDRGLVDKLVIVVPHSLMGNWAKEVRNWTKGKGDLDCTIWPKQEENLAYVLNYEAFAVGNAKGVGFVRNLCDGHRVMLVLDESTQIKNQGSVRTRALLSLARDAKFTRILSGAPMVQGPQDLWAQLKFIGEMRGTNYFQYRNRYCTMGGHMGKQIIGANHDRIGEVQQVLAACAFRAKKSDWLDLPAKTPYIRDVTLSPKYAAAYKTMQRDLMMTVGDQEVTAPMAITLMLKLQQISSGFMLDDMGNPMFLEGANAKLNELISIIDTELDTKVIVPVYFQESQRLLQEAFTKNGIKFAKILSQMSPEEIEHEKSLFNEDPEYKVALAQTSSQKYGHTLLGTENVPCFTTIFYENTFSLDDRLQMEDRNHRIGQRFSVNIIDLSCSPIEKRVLEALQKKQSLAEVIVDAIRTTNT